MYFILTDCYLFICILCSSLFQSNVFPLCPLQLYCTLSQSIYLICRRNIVDLAQPVNAWKEFNAYENLEIHVEHFLQNSIDRGVQACKDVSTPIIKLSYENALLIDRPMAQHRKKSINCMDQTVGHIFFSELKTQCFYRSYLIF